MELQRKTLAFCLACSEYSTNISHDYEERFKEIIYSPAGLQTLLPHSWDHLWAALGTGNGLRNYHAAWRLLLTRRL